MKIRCPRPLDDGAMSLLTRAINYKKCPDLVKGYTKKSFIGVLNGTGSIMPLVFYWLFVVE